MDNEIDAAVAEYIEEQKKGKRTLISHFLRNIKNSASNMKLRKIL